MEDVTEDQNPAPTGAGEAEPLSRRVDALERRLRELIEHNSREVRTQRVVVIEDDGFERIVLQAGGTHGEVTVVARSDEPGAAAAEMYAHDPSDGDEATAGVTLVRSGNLEWTRDLLNQRSDQKSG